MPKTKSETKEKKPKKVKKPKKEESDDENPVEEFANLEVEEKPKKKVKKQVEFRPETPEQEDEEEQICHMCGDCGQEFDCPDGKFNKSGKFKCSCLKEKDQGDLFFFCSEACLQGTEADGEKGDNDQESDGYDSV